MQIENGNEFRFQHLPKLIYRFSKYDRVIMKRCCAIALIVILLVPAAAVAAGEILPPSQSNPVERGVMSEFPPEPERLVTLANMLRFPQMRWSFHNIRQLVPTSNIWKGPTGHISKLSRDPYPVGEITFTGRDGKKHTVMQWLKSTYTDGFIVLDEGQVAFEYYTKGMKPHYPHLMWSVTKSVVGTIASDLIAHGKIDPGALVTDYIPELKNSAWAGATVQQTLDMTTAIQFTEEYSNPQSDIWQYAIAAGVMPAPNGYHGPLGVYAYLPTLEKGGEHGKQFTYRTVNPEVIAWIIQRVTDKSLNKVVSNRIWQPLGAQFNAYFVVDSHGTEVAGGGMNATLRDLARFADMIRQHGRYNGRRIVSKEAIGYLFQQGYPVKLPPEHYSGGRQGYSYHNFWWLSNNADHVIEAWGIHGQIIHINPTDDVVIVKLSSRPAAGNSPFTAMATAAFKAIDNTLAAQE